MTRHDSPPGALALAPLTMPALHRPPAWIRPLQVTGIFLGWLAVVVLATLVHPFPPARPYALFAHLVFLAMSFGAVLAVELQGLGLLVRLSSVERLVHVAAGLDPLIWLGLAGMAASGVILGPHLDRPLTIVKLMAVLVVAINGLWARDLVRALRDLPTDIRRLPGSLVRRAARVSLVSQAGWWTAVIIGFLTSNSA